LICHDYPDGSLHILGPTGSNKQRREGLLNIANCTAENHTPSKSKA